MKRSLLLLICAIVGIGAACADKKPCDKPSPKMWQEIQAFKIKFLSQEMDLRHDQRGRFTELYTELSEKKRENFDAVRKAEKEIENKKNATDADYADLSNKLDELRAKNIALEKEYDTKFSKFLTSKQLYQLRVAEDKFRRKMEEMRHKRKVRINDGKKNSSRR